MLDRSLPVMQSQNAFKQQQNRPPNSLSSGVFD